MEGYESKEVFIVKQIADMLEESGNTNGAASLRLFADTFELIVKENDNLKKSIESKWMNGLLGLADKALDGRFEEMQAKSRYLQALSDSRLNRLDKLAKIADESEFEKSRLTIENERLRSGLEYLAARPLYDETAKDLQQQAQNILDGKEAWGENKEPTN